MILSRQHHIARRGMTWFRNYWLDRSTSCQRSIHNKRMSTTHSRCVHPGRQMTKRYFSLNSDNDHSTFPILIVGGGPSGLFLASLLQRYGVNFCLLEAQPEEQHFQHPQAHFLNTRTMEILKNYLPSVHEQVIEAMPPVEEWKRFHFGPTMRSSNVMATVKHPVHAPFVANSNANGILLSNKINDVEFEADDPSSSVPLSDCSVGHLAQHQFHQILYNQVQQKLCPTRQVHFGDPVIHAEQHDDDDGSSLWKVTTNSGQVYQAPLVVAADGANSIWRQKFLKVGMSGQPIIQRLINVHFTLEQLPDPDMVPPAMLYTVFSSQVLAMVVRHSPTEYVMQIPYFPPYQTVTEDFSEEKVTNMVHAALGNDTISPSSLSSSSIGFKIRSIRPWTMGSLVADSLAKQDVYLVGDAAHVFPPAGGFGMNTGLQDVLALAWRLKWKVDQDQSVISDPLQVYSKERQGVAYQNAALSVRNYNRVLGVMRTCYLDERNLPVLLKSLETSARLGMPMAWQKASFQNLFRTALMPLQMLQDAPTSLYSKHVTNNLRRLLQAGQGLPLLFPNHEVAFAYPTPLRSGTNTLPNINETADWSRDSFADLPQLKDGRLFPHIPCQVIGSNDQNWTSTRDLPSRLATVNHPCPFCLLKISFLEDDAIPNDFDHANVSTITGFLTEQLGAYVAPANLFIRSNTESSLSCTGDGDGNVVSFWTSQREWDRRQLVQDDLTMDQTLLVLIRPDGHIAGVYHAKQDINHTKNDMLMAARYALGRNIEESASS